MTVDVEPPEDDPNSSFRLEITLSVGYQRKRATLGGAFEGHVVTIALLLVGAVIVILAVIDLTHLAEKLPF